MSDDRSPHPASPGADPKSVLAQERAALRQSLQKALGDEAWARWRLLPDLPVLAVLVIVLTAMFAASRPGLLDMPALDSIADETLRAERGLVTEDRRATEQRRQSAAESVPVIFEYDSDLYFNLGEQVHGAVRSMVERRDADELDIAARRAALADDLGVPVAPAVFTLLETLDDPLDLAIAINFFLNIALDRMVVADRAELPRTGGAEVRDLVLGETTRLSHTGSILDLRQVRRVMTARAGDAPYGSARVVRTWILQTARALARANLTRNDGATTQARQAAVAAVEPVMLRTQVGEVLVRKGDRVNASVRERIAAINEGHSGTNAWVQPLGLAALIGGVIGLLALAIRAGRLKPVAGRKGVYMQMATFAIGAAVALIAVYAGRGLTDGLDLLPDSAPYFVPVALVTVLAALLLDSATGVLLGVALALLVTYRVGGDAALIVYYTTGVLVAGLFAGHIRRRTELLRLGLAIAAAQAMVVPLTVLLAGDAFTAGHMAHLLASLAAGVLVAVVALAVLPVIEYLFDEASDLRLLELASSDHPALKALALHAPGSYHAAVIVANMVEAAAEVVSANALKCRVMALYHDIGKAARASYFAENQRDDNIHDRLPPEISARVVFGHIREGLAVARKHRLGRPVVEAISQHHGTTLLRPFFVKASEAGPVEEADYRYPGPRPRSPEAGIVMLADSVEAATRALANPDIAALRQRIRQVIHERVEDGQLDESGLKLRDIGQIEVAFERVLSLGVYHTRVDYPPMPAHRPGHATGEPDGDRTVHSLGRLEQRPR
ncbi:MAG: HDIG domain-containing protein [Alphaproteobacteria bacterium]